MRFLFILKSFMLGGIAPQNTGYGAFFSVAWPPAMTRQIHYGSSSRGTGTLRQHNPRLHDVKAAETTQHTMAALILSS